MSRPDPLAVDLMIDAVHLATFSDLLDDEYGEIRDACLAVRAGRIVYAGPVSAAPAMDPAHTLDGGGAWLTPGLVDCHTHLVYAGSRADEFEALRQGRTYAEIAADGGGIRRTVSATRAAAETALRDVAQQRLHALLREGVTTVEIKSGYGLDLPSELKMLRVARALGETNPVSVAATCLAAHAVPEEYAGDPDAYLDLVIDEILPAVKEAQLAESVDVFCERIAFDAAQAARLFTTAQSLGFAVRGHVEQLSQQQGCDVVCEYRGLSADHLEYVSDAQAERMGQAGVVAVMLPGAFYYLGETRRPPIDSFRRHGVPMAVATDLNPGSSPLCSVLTAANLACVQFGMTPGEAFAGITAHGARALGLAHRRGQLREEFDADLLLWEVEHPRQIIHEIGRFRPRRIWWQGQEQRHD